MLANLSVYTLGYLNFLSVKVVGILLVSKFSDPQLRFQMLFSTWNLKMTAIMHTVDEFRPMTHTFFNQMILSTCCLLNSHHTLPPMHTKLCWCDSITSLMKNSLVRPQKRPSLWLYYFTGNNLPLLSIIDVSHTLRSPLFCS